MRGRSSLASYHPHPNLPPSRGKGLVQSFPNSSTANCRLQLIMVVAFSKWWGNSNSDRSSTGQHKAKVGGRFPGRPSVLTDRQEEYVRDVAKVILTTPPGILTLLY